MSKGNSSDDCLSSGTTGDDGTSHDGTSHDQPAQGVGNGSRPVHSCRREADILSVYNRLHAC